MTMMDSLAVVLQRRLGKPLVVNNLIALRHIPFASWYCIREEARTRSPFPNSCAARMANGVCLVSEPEAGAGKLAGVRSS